MAMVNMKSVSKCYGTHCILNEINLTIGRGEFVAIVGPSGCGKSTLLRLVAGLDAVTSGDILINDKCVNKTPPAARDMAMVFQNYALYPHMTAYDNMAYGLKMRGVKKNQIRERVEEVARLLQMTDYLNRKPLLLSGGQRQRVAMGRAIVRSPAVFLFDEPLSNLDAKLRTEMRYEIKKLHQQLKTTSLYVTHDQTEAMTMADRIVILNKGLIEQVGTPQDLYHKPGSMFVASFIGHYPMNFIPANIDLKQHVVTTVMGSTLPLPILKKSMNCKDPVMIGVRPEHLYVSPKPTLDTFIVKILFVDDLGADKVVQVSTLCGDLSLSVRVAGGTLLHDEHLNIGMDLNKANLFCQKTETRLGGWSE